MFLIQFLIKIPILLLVSSIALNSIDIIFLPIIISPISSAIIIPITAIIISLQNFFIICLFIIKIGLVAI